MERIDVSEHRYMADLVAAVERGDEVVIIRENEVVARLAPERGPVSPDTRIFDMEALEELHRKFSIRFGGSGALIREMRMMDDH